MTTAEAKITKNRNSTITGVALGFFIIMPAVSCESLMSAIHGITTNGFDQVMTVCAFWVASLLFSLKLARSLRGHFFAANLVGAVCLAVMCLGGAKEIHDPAGLAAAYNFGLWTATMLAGWLAAWQVAGIINPDNREGK